MTKHLCSRTSELRLSLPVVFVIALKYCILQELVGTTSHFLFMFCLLSNDFGLLSTPHSWLLTKLFSWTRQFSIIQPECTPQNLPLIMCKQIPTERHGPKGAIHITIGNIFRW